MSLKSRVERLERKLKPGELSAAASCLHDFNVHKPFDVHKPLAADDPILQQGVDEKGQAFISRWWAICFLEGSTDQQNLRLRQLRLDPAFQKPCDDDVGIRFEGGAIIEDVYNLIDEEDERAERDARQKLLGE